MTGLLVHGDNHFVVRGPEPDDAAAQALVRHWSIIQIGQQTPEHLKPWLISTKEFREELRWAVIVGPGPHTAAVDQLLTELAARGISIRQTSGI